jgi:hypothetical protein
MIRRDHGSNWLIISQVDHARLAADVASVWGNDCVPTLPEPELLVAAIRNHDDGWDEWEQAIRIDPATGRPRNFTEMLMSEATHIWLRSIEQCCYGKIHEDSPGDDQSTFDSEGAARSHSPLSGIWVSCHFCWLAKKARKNRQGSFDDQASITKFLKRQSQLRRTWKQEADQPEEVLESGFRYIQFFDRLSLWLCQSAELEELKVVSHDEQIFRFAASESNLIKIEPYPLSVAELSLSVTARCIPARRYKDDNDLQAAIQNASITELTWKLAQ